MSDLIGTVRHEGHGDGFSVWVKVAQEKFDAASRETFVAAEWLCVYSTARGNCGQRLPHILIELPDHPIVGVVPGTPAHRTAVSP